MKKLYSLRKRILIIKGVASIRHASVFALSVVLCLFLVISGSGLISFTAAAATDEEKLAANEAMDVETNDITGWPNGPTVGAEAAILMEADTGVILYSKNIHMQEYPASTTKILTCLIAAENCELDEEVVFSHDAVFDTPRDSNNIAIDEGESLTVEECLEAILIRSANECAFALAEHVCGSSWEDFAELMNERAEELGCVDSHFVNPNGLPNDDHYTSAYDLAMIGRAFFDNELLCKISLMTRLHIYPSANQPDEIIENTTNQMLAGKTYEYQYLVGSKTGTTEAAGSCLVSCAEKDGLKLICVVLDDVNPNQYTDTIALFDYGFSNFEYVNVSETDDKYNISQSGTFGSMVDVLGDSTPILSVDAEDYVIVPKTIDFSDLTSEISYDTTGTGEAAVINYYFGGIWLGKASVDFTSSGKTYDFDELPESMAAKTEEEEIKEETQVVFINIVRIAIIVAGACLAALLLFLLVRGIVRYRKKHPNWRANWKRERRKRKSRVRRMSIHQEARKHRQEFINSDKRRERGRRRVRRRMK